MTATRLSVTGSGAEGPVLSCVFSVFQSSDSVTKLRQILDQADSLLRMFWRAALPNMEDTKQVRTNTERQRERWPPPPSSVQSILKELHVDLCVCVCV